MVKGVTKRVIVLKAPDPKLFEEAIFIVRDDIPRAGLTDKDILRQAQQVAGQCFRSGRQRTAVKLSRLFWALGGAGAMGLVWLATAVF